MGRADDARVDIDRLPSADPLDHTLLEESKQLHLERKRDVPDLVEEQGSALCHFDLADVGLDRPGERAALVTEQLGFQQVLGDRCAVDGDEWTGCPIALFVDRPCEKLLAGAAGAEQHHRHVGRGHALDGSADLEHFGRGGDDRSEHRRPARLLQPPVLRLDPVKMKGPRDDQPELVDIDRLPVEVIGSERDGLHRAFAGAVAGCDDDLGVGF